MPDPRLRDVAERAAVSMTTASIVLRRLPGARISPETRARVERAAAEIGYRPRERHRDVRLIAITLDPAAGRENVLFLAAVMEAARHRDRLVVLLPEPDDGSSGGRPVLDGGQLPLDGYVHVEARHSFEPPPELAGHAAAVRLRPGGSVAGTSRTATLVVPDDRGAAAALAPALSDAGHRRVAIVVGEDEAVVGRSWQEGLASGSGELQSSLVLVGTAARIGEPSEYEREGRSLDEVTALLCMSAASAREARVLVSAGHLRVAPDVVVLVRGAQDGLGAVAADVAWLPLPTAEMARLTMAAVLGERADGQRLTAQDDGLIVVPFPLPTRLTIPPPAAPATSSATKPLLQQRSSEIIQSARGGAQ